MAGEWIYDMPEADYFGDTSRLSNSRISDWLTNRDEYLRPDLKGLPSDEMKFGKYFDAALTEGVEVARERFVVAPARDDGTLIDRRTKQWKEFAAGLGGKEWICPEHHAQVVAMLQALSNHEDDRCKAGALLWPTHAGRNQVVGHWEDAATGRRMRCRIDRLPSAQDPVWGRPVVVDLKTTGDASPESWQRGAHRFGYHRQGAMYLDAYRAIEGTEAVFAWVIVERPAKLGYRPRVCVRWSAADDVAIEHGRAQYREAIEQIEEFERTGDSRLPWEKCSSNHQLPGWVESRLVHKKKEQVGRVLDQIRGVG